LTSRDGNYRYIAIFEAGGGGLGIENSPTAQYIKDNNLQDYTIGVTSKTDFLIEVDGIRELKALFTSCKNSGIAEQQAIFTPSIWMGCNCHAPRAR